MNVDMEKTITNDKYLEKENSQTVNPSDETGTPKVMRVKKTNNKVQKMPYYIQKNVSCTLGF